MNFVPKDSDSEELTSYLDSALVMVATATNGKPSTVPFTYAGGIVTIGEHRIKMRTIAEHSTTEKDNFFLGARFEVILDDSLVPQLSYWTVAVGKSKQDIVKTAVQQWYMAFGRTVFDAIAGQPTPLSCGRYRIYPGYTGIRGTAPDGWKNWGGDNMHNRIIPAIAPSLSNVDQFHASDILITVRENG